MLKSIKTSNYRSIDKDGTSIEFSKEKKHGVVIGPNGCGKSNFIQSLVKPNREDDDIPFAGSSLEGKIELKFLFDNVVVSKTIIYPDDKYSIEIQGLEKGINKVLPPGVSLNQAIAFSHRLAQLESSHNLAGLSRHFKGYIDSSSLEFVNNFTVTFIPNILKWADSLILNLDKFNNPDGLMVLIKKHLGERQLTHFARYLSGESIDSQSLSSLHDKLNQLLKKLSEPITGLDLELDRYMRLGSENQIKITTKQDTTFVNFENRSDGEELIVSFLLMLEDLGNMNAPQLILIDEIEKSLDPQNQNLISTLIANTPENLNFLITTHSPYIYRNKTFTDCARLFVAKKLNNSTKIESYEENEKRVLDYDSWAEINFLAYGVYSVEYHNELFGQVTMEREEDFMQLDKFFFKKKMKLKGYARTAKDDISKAVSQICSYAPDCGVHKKDKNETTHCLPIATVIRHVTSHSENNFNKRVSQEDLEYSTNFLRNLLFEIQNSVEEG